MTSSIAISIMGDDRSTTEALAIALQTRGLQANLISNLFTLSSPAVLILIGQGSLKRLRAQLETARPSFPHTTIVILAGGSDRAVKHDMPGITTGCLATVDTFEKLVQTLERLRDDRPPGSMENEPNSTAETAVRQRNLDQELTAREQGVFQLIAAGFSNKEIANLLSISLCTVKNHVHNILAKLDIPRRGYVLGRTYLPRIQKSAPARFPIATRRKVRITAPDHA